MSQNKKYIGFPEDFFKIPIHQENDLNIDVLLTLLNRSSAIINLLESSGEDLTSGFSINHEDVLFAIGSINGMLQQADEMVRHANN